MSRPAGPIPREISFRVRFFPENLGKGPQFYVEMGPANDPGIWDAGAMSLPECLEWVQSMLQDQLHDHFG